MKLDANTNWSDSTLNRRRVLAGTAGLGAAALLGAKLVQAQSAPSTPGAGSSTGASKASAEQARYDDFLSKMATNLGVADAATVDKAIRASVTQMVEEELAGGHISQDAANKMKANIDSTNVPFIFDDWDDMMEGHHDDHDDHQGEDSDSKDNNSVDATPPPA